MHMRQAALLILDGLDGAAVAAKDVPLLKVMQEVFKLHVEDLGN